MEQTTANPALEAMRNFVTVYTEQIAPYLKQGDYRDIEFVILDEVTRGALISEDEGETRLAETYGEKYAHYTLALRLLAGFSNRISESRSGPLEGVSKTAIANEQNERIKRITHHVSKLSKMLS